MCCFFSIQNRFSTGFVVRKIWPSKRLRFYWVIWPSEMQEGRSGLLSPTNMFWLDSWDTRITRLRWESLTLTMPDPLVLLHHLQLNLEVIIISWFGFFFQWKGNFLFIQIEFNQSFLNLFLLIANKKRITSFSPQILHFQEWLKLLFMCLLNLYFLINI